MIKKKKPEDFGTRKNKLRGGRLTKHHARLFLWWREGKNDGGRSK